MSQPGHMSSRFGQPSLLVSLHSHREALLVVSLRGTATLGIGDRDWHLPPRTLLWLAGSTPHRLHTSSDHHSLILSFPPELVRRASGWLEASGFVHDLIDRVARADDPERRDRLTAVLFDELAEPLSLDARLTRVTELVTRNPMPSVAEIARQVGMSERSFRRWFRDDIGTSFTEWHQRHVVERAIRQLERGESVKRVAAELGYNSTSAFSAMFKRVTNASPQRYMNPR